MLPVSFWLLLVSACLQMCNVQTIPVDIASKFLTAAGQFWLKTYDLHLIPVDVDSVLLAYPVRSRHGLEVVLGVPVAVKDDHGVSSGQVDAQPPCSGGQQEGKITGAWSIEVLHRLHTMACFAY